MPYARKVAVRECEAFETDGELDVARSDNVLDLKVHELGREAELLDDAGVLARCQARELLVLGTGAHHLTRRKDERRRLGLANTHDDGRETLWSSRHAFPQRERGAGELVHHTYDTISSRHAPRKHRSHNRATAAGGARYLGVVFGVTGMQGNVLQIEPAAEVDGRHDVPVIARHRGECHSEEEERASGRECGHTVAWE